MGLMASVQRMGEGHVRCSPDKGKKRVCLTSSLSPPSRAMPLEDDERNRNG